MNNDKKLYQCNSRMDAQVCLSHPLSADRLLAIPAYRSLLHALDILVILSRAQQGQKLPGQKLGRDLVR